jgi:cystathionine beta-lyase
MCDPFQTQHFRRDTDSLKWRLHPPDVLPLWVADLDFPAPEPVLAALRRRLEHGILGYPETAMGPEAGAAGLREVLVQRMADRYGWNIQPEDLVFIPGVVTGFNLACHAIGEPGDGVLVQPPVYMPFLGAAQQAGKVRRDAPLVQAADGAYEVDWDAFEAALTWRTRLFLLCSPHNPVGRVWRRDELQRMADLCLRHGVTLCSDEIHCDLVFAGHRHVPLASLDPEVARHTITLMAPSKTFNIAGLTCSFAIIQDAALRRRFLSARHGLVPWVNLLGIVAAEAAYRSGQPWLDGLLRTLDGNRQFLAEAVQRHLPGIRMVPLEGTYLAWLDAREAELGPTPAQFFLERAKVALIDGAAFGRGGEGFVRLNFGCAQGLLEEALQRMGEALAHR